MQLTNSPAKLPLPFASAGAKNTIPEASQIGITAGAASLTDGFPPLTRTPVAAGGVPPSGLDMNGILYELSAVVRWANAGGGYAYDSTFANDSNVNGYPKGARVMRSDGLGYWINTVENNLTDPEAAGAAAAGWVPDFTSGATAVTMTSANVTLTPLQYGKPVIVITGTLTANLNLIFPAIVGEWTVINSTTGAFTITCKTASGTGVVVNTVAMVSGDGTNIVFSVNDAAALLNNVIASASGTSDAITVTIPATVRSYAQIAGVPFWVRAASANTTTTPTIAVNGLVAQTIVKGANGALSVGDISGAGHWLQLQYDATLGRVVLLNPAYGVSQSLSRQLQSLTATVASNALTVTLNPTTLDFRSSDLTSGVPVSRTVSSVISLVVPSGATLGTVSGNGERLIVAAIDNAGTVELAICNVSGGLTLNETGLISTTAISAASSSNAVWYSTTARTNVAYRIVGSVSIAEATAGTWATGPTNVQNGGTLNIVSLNSLGFGQTWQDVTASRAAGTTYYNTTGRPITINCGLTATSINGQVNFTINGVALVGGSTGAAGSTNQSQLTGLIIPPGASYSATLTNASAISKWFELR